MLIRKLAAICLALAFFAAVHTAVAQDSDQPEPQKQKTLADRLDNLGKTIFGGIRSDDTAKPKAASHSKASSNDATATDFPDGSNATQSNARRAGSVLTGDTVDQADAPPRTPSPTVPRVPDEAPAMSGRPMVAVSSQAQNDVPNEPKPQAAIEAPRNPPADQSSVKPLYERLSASRQSAFGSDDAQDSHPQSNAQQSPAAEPPAAKPSTSEEPQPKRKQRAVVAQRIKPDLDVGSAPPAEPILDSAAGLPSTPDKGMSRRMPVAIENTSPTIEATPSTGDKLPPAFDRQPTVLNKFPHGYVRRPVVISNTPPATEPAPAVADPAPRIAEPAPRVAEPAPRVAEPAADDGLLIARKSPVLNVETLGPRRIAVGKESTYEVGIANSGDVAAEDLLVFVALPEWAEVVSADVSSGTAQATSALQTAGAVQWKLGHLDAKGRERMTLKIIPHQSRPFDLAVRWESRPTASQAMIEVQEAKLALQLEGPREVLYGKKETYRLRVTNVGNGAADGVAIMLMPLGGGDNVPATHKIGVLRAGEEKTLDVDLTARQAGNLTIQVDARAEDGIHAELAEGVVVRRAGLKIDVDGPKMLFMGVPASYVVHVRNPGTAPARNVNLSLALPAGAKYLSGVEEAKLDASGSKVEWMVENLGPDAEQSFVLKCSLSAAGAEPCSSQRGGRR